MRITIDMDEPTVVDLQRAWKILEEYGTGEPAGRVSSSGMGIHLKVHGFDGDLEDTITPRARAGDDPDRIYIDMDGVRKPAQILFSRKPKSGDYAGEWLASLDTLIAEYQRRAPVEIRCNIPNRITSRL